MATIKQKITPFLWFDDNAEEAIEFYCSVFENSRLVSISRYGEGAPRPVGSVMSAEFELEGLTFYALNGGPMFKFTEAISFMVACENQKEVDRLWEKLSGGGEIQMCGWLKDRFGLSWQIIPTAFWDLMSDKDNVRKARVMQALMQMKKMRWTY